MPVKFLVRSIVRRSPEGRRSFGVRRERIDPACTLSTTACLNSGVGKGGTRRGGHSTHRSLPTGRVGWNRLGQATKPNGSPKMHDPETRRPEQRTLLGRNNCATVGNNAARCLQAARIRRLSDRRETFGPFTAFKRYRPQENIADISWNSFFMRFIPRIGLILLEF